jgi:8-oxo-dGTP diphosphatase
VRELEEEWAVRPLRVRGEALIRLPHQLVMFVGQAWLAEGDDARVRPDHEHDDYSWWPSDIDAWPSEAGEALTAMARYLSA